MDEQQETAHEGLVERELERRERHLHAREAVHGAVPRGVLVAHGGREEGHGGVARPQHDGARRVQRGLVVDLRVGDAHKERVVRVRRCAADLDAAQRAQQQLARRTHAAHHAHGRLADVEHRTQHRRRTLLADMLARSPRQQW